ncbi:hypothetical protein BN3661_01774 [Eubacteriaceae bacterium CHKCI005]|nr:hypothetical protein BN3661_01774 [Eubacteriaceae bacterium CHKCI005]
MERRPIYPETEASSSGSCIISERVLASIASTAASEVEGVASLAKHTHIKGLFSQQRVARSVVITSDENELILDLYVNLNMGCHIPTVAGAIQKNVKEAIQSMTGRVVTRVNVHVANVALEPQEA